MLFIHQHATAQPGAPPGVESAPYLEDFKLKKGAIAHTLGSAVFEASGLIVSRLLVEGTGPARPAPAAGPTDPPEGEPAARAATSVTAAQSDPPAGERSRSPSGRARTPRKRRKPRQSAGPPVILGKFGDEPIVNGKRKARLNKPRFDVIEALLAAGDDGLSKDSLATESGHGDAHRILGRLAQSDADWKAVIQMAEIPGGRYRIRSASLPTSPDISRRAPTKRNKG
jgi:hypothetical protein